MSTSTAGLDVVRKIDISEIVRTVEGVRQEGKHLCVEVMTPASRWSHLQWLVITDDWLLEHGVCRVSRLVSRVVHYVVIEVTACVEVDPPHVELQRHIVLCNGPGMTVRACYDIQASKLHTGVILK